MTQNGEGSSNNMKRTHQFMTATAAAKIAGVVSQSTIKNWCEKYPSLGVKVMGRWRINPDVLDAMLRGEKPETKQDRRA